MVVRLNVGDVALAGIVGALLMACILAILAAPAEGAGPSPCPDPRNRDEDYMCPLGPTFMTPALSDFAGFDEKSHWGNIAYGDIRGTGRDDLVARGPNGVQVYRWSPTAEQWIQLDVPPILPDSEGWGKPLRMYGFDVGDIDGDGRDELVARGEDGMVVFRFLSDRNGNGGRWEQLTTKGPFPTTGWRAPEYYTTIELTPIGARPGKGTMQIAARGQQGYGVWRWNGNGWAPLNGLTALSDANGFDDPKRYLTIEAWDDELLFARAKSGMAVYRYDGKANDWERLSSGGPCGIEPDDWRSSFPCDTHTIRLARGIKGAGKDPVLLARDSRTSMGVQLARFDVSKRRWVYAVTNRAPWGEKHYGQHQYGVTVQTADVDGDGNGEVLGRSIRGFAVFQPTLGSEGRVSWGQPVSNDRPRLEGEPWDRARHFGTIETVRVRDGRRASLVARGPYGLRTWHWDGKRERWERPLPYGEFPEIDERVMDALSGWLGIARGTLRDVFTDPTRDASTNRLAQLQRDLESTCAELEQTTPPRYARCTVPRGVRGVGDAAWTEAANELIQELYWARNVVDYFDALNTTQQGLFLDQLGEFPSITADLALKSPPVEFGVDVDEIFGMTLQTIIGLEIPVAKQVAGVIGLTLGWIAATSPRMTGEQPSEFKVKTSELQAEMTRLRQEMRDTLVRHRRYVLADAGLLGAVGRQVAGGVWSYDEQLIHSAARQSFATELYQSILPTLWDHWTVTDCDRQQGPSTRCTSPDAGPLLSKATRERPRARDPERVWYYHDFDGLVPKQDPCDHDLRLAGNRNCRWQSLESWGYGPTIKTLLDPIPDDCRYDPVTQTSWRYGCALAVPREELLSPGPDSPWRFRVRRCDYPSYDQPAIACHVQAE